MSPAPDLLDWTPSGTYDGKLSIGPTAKNSLSIPVTVTVQDLVVWPLLAVVLGALLAWWYIWWNDEQRPKRLIKAELRSAATKYGDRFRDTPAENRLYTLDSIIDPNWSGACPAPNNAPESSRLYCRLLSSKDQEEVNETGAKIADIVKRVDLWPEVCATTGAIKVAQATLEQTKPGTQMSAATDDMLHDTVQKPPSDAHSTREVLGDFKRQRDALELCEACWVLHGQVAEVYRSLQPCVAAMLREERARVHALDPDALMEVYLVPARSLADLTGNAVAEKYRDTLRDLLALQRAYGAPPRPQPAGAQAQKAVAMASLGVFPWPAPGLETPEQILASVRRHDLLGFAVTTVAAVLLFLVTIYAGKAFGSVWDYLTAVLTGLSGQLLINWKLLPWYRSYRPETPDIAEPATE